MYECRRLIMLGAGILVVALVVLGVRLHSEIKKERATQIAREYIGRQYPQEDMKYIHTRKPLITVDGAWYYSVYFSPVGKDGMTVTVKISPNFKTREDEGGFIKDDYPSAYFKWQMENRYKEDVDRIWGGTANPYIHLSITTRDVSKPLDEKEAWFGGMYDLNVSVSKTLNKEAAPDEAALAFKFIRAVQDSGFSPESITFVYDWEKTTKNGNKWVWVSFRDWETIADVSEVEGRYADSVAEAEAE
jgi:hypothetical protein